MQARLIERKVNLRRMSNLNNKLLLVSGKEDVLSKYCVTSMDPWNMKAKKMVGAEVPEIEKEALKIKELYERYVFATKGSKITKFYVDFLPGEDGKLYFLQIKYFECESKFIYDPQKIQRIKVKKGLGGKDSECTGIFCKGLDGCQALQELITHLIVNGSLSKTWSKAGNYLIPTKDIKDYDLDLQQYEYYSIT